MFNSSGEHPQSSTTGRCNAGKSSDDGSRRKKARVIADVKAAIAERKQNREEEVGQTKGTLPPAKQCRQDNGTERNTDGHAEMSCTQQDAASATEKVTRSANAAKVARKGKSFQ